MGVHHPCPPEPDACSELPFGARGLLGRDGAAPLLRVLPHPGKPSPIYPPPLHSGPLSPSPPCLPVWPLLSQFPASWPGPPSSPRLTAVLSSILSLSRGILVRQACQPGDPCPTGVPGPPATRGKTQLLNTTLGGLRVLTPVPRSWWGPPSPPDALDPPSPAWVFPRPLPPAPIPSPAASFRKPGEQAGHACIPVPAVQRLAITCLTAAFSL